MHIKRKECFPAKAKTLTNKLLLHDLRTSAYNKVNMMEFIKYRKTLIIP